MRQSDPELNRLFRDMAAQSAAPEAVDARSRRRQRAIGGMRALHRRIVDDRSRMLRKRRYWSLALIAAAVALCGTALAGAGGFLHFTPVQEVSRAIPRAHWLGRRSSVTAAAAAPTPSARAEPVASAASPTPTASKAERLETTHPAASAGPNTLQSTELERVNLLFAEAKRARREHRDAEALRLVQQLLAEHPGSVLAHEASVERFRALARLGRAAEAQRYAGSYLARYPNGYAAAEAQRIVNGERP